MKCPYCAEEILDDARACRYCGRNLSLAQENKRLREKASLLESQLSAALATREAQETGQESPGKEHGTEYHEEGNDRRIGHRTGQSRPIPALVLTVATLFSFLSPILSLLLYIATGDIFVLFMLSLLPLPLGFWIGVNWPGRHLKAYILLSLCAGLPWIGLGLIPRLGLFLATGLATAVLFTAGALFGDLREKAKLWRSRGSSEEVRESVSGQVASRLSNLSSANQKSSETILLVVQSLGPTTLALLGTLITAIVTFAR